MAGRSYKLKHARRPQLPLCASSNVPKPGHGGLLLQLGERRAHQWRRRGVSRRDAVLRGGAARLAAGGDQEREETEEGAAGGVGDDDGERRREGRRQVGGQCGGQEELQVQGRQQVQNA